MICAEFPSGGVPESFWIGDLQYGDEGFKGVVATPASSASDVTNGQSVRVPISSVTDWAYVQDGKLIGGFTIRLLRSRMSETERQSYDSQLPYRIE